MNANYKNNGDRNSVQDSFRPITFHCVAPGAKCVYVTGDFNRWKRVAMARRQDGWWYLQICLCQGQHQYRFIVDGKSTLDRFAAEVGKDVRGRVVSLLRVG